MHFERGLFEMSTTASGISKNTTFAARLTRHHLATPSPHFEKIHWHSVVVAAGAAAAALSSREVSWKVRWDLCGARVLEPTRAVEMSGNVRDLSLSLSLSFERPDPFPSSSRVAGQRTRLNSPQAKLVGYVTAQPPSGSAREEEDRQSELASLADVALEHARETLPAHRQRSGGEFPWRITLETCVGDFRRRLPSEVSVRSLGLVSRAFGHSSSSVFSHDTDNALECVGTLPQVL